MLLDDDDFILLTQYLITSLNGRSEHAPGERGRSLDCPDQVAPEQPYAPFESDRQ